ncbi:hypothetical protein FQN57_004087 [Myotisia sp. PD_48]|nr:hypothetical protein FQN57_004087 [Myotisia sp. PD_48]
MESKPNLQLSTETPNEPDSQNAPTEQNNNHEQPKKIVGSKLALLIVQNIECAREVCDESNQTLDAAAIVKRHIRLLHDYNEIKDIGQGLMGLIADGRGLRYVDVQTEFGIEAGD